MSKRNYKLTFLFCVDREELGVSVTRGRFDCRLDVVRGLLFGVPGWLFGVRGWLFGVRGWLFGVREWCFGVFGWLFGVRGEMCNSVFSCKSRS